MSYQLAKDGDMLEQRYFKAFIDAEFPSYAAFWTKHVPPLTNRPANIHFKTTPQLQAAGKTESDLVIAQLHYTILRHLAVVFDIRRVQVVVDDLTNGLVRIVGAQDLAFELLERYANPGAYDPWLANGKSGAKGGKQARQAWQKANAYPLQPIRDYRNHLVHGRMSPVVIGGNQVFVPRIGIEEAYFDWRTVTQNQGLASLLGSDLVQPNAILDDVWKQTVGYFEAQWKAHLL